MDWHRMRVVCDQCLHEVEELRVCGAVERVCVMLVRCHGKTELLWPSRGFLVHDEDTRVVLLSTIKGLSVVDSASVLERIYVDSRSYVSARLLSVIATHKGRLPEDVDPELVRLVYAVMGDDVFEGIDLERLENASVALMTLYERLRDDSRKV